MLLACSSSGGDDNSGAQGGSTSQSTFYIDPSAVDPGDGSYVFPYKSWHQVSFKQGCAYLQKRGTIARDEINIDTSGSADSPIVISAYGIGADPIIQGSEIVVGWAGEGGHIYSKTIDLQSGGLGMVAEDGVVLTYHEWDTDAATTFSSAAMGSFSYDDNAGKVYIWCRDNSPPDTRTIEVSRRHFGIHGDHVAHINISDMVIRYTSLHGISFADSNNITISNCTVEKLGGSVISADPLIHAGNGIEFGDSSSECTVTSVTINDIFDSGFSAQTYSTGKNAFNFTISDSTINRCGFAGIEIAALLNTDKINSSIDNVTVTNVTITDAGIGWSGRRYNTEGRGIKVNADIDGADNSRTIDNLLIQDCTISGSAGEGILLSGNSGKITIERCIIEGSGGDGILVQESEATTLLLKLYSSIIERNGAGNNRNGVTFNVPGGNGLVLYHNTFYNNEFLGLNIWAHSGSATIVNNLFHAPTFKTHLYVNVALAGAPEISNNGFTEFGQRQWIINYNASNVYDYAADFNSAYGFSADNAGTTDPMLNNDLSLQSNTSPCYQAGKSATGVSIDIMGNNFRNPPSIGAYEY